jgi:hypothetical protein
VLGCVQFFENERENIDNRGEPMESLFINQTGADVAGDDRFFVLIGDFSEKFVEEMLLQSFGAVIEETVDKRVFGIFAKGDRFEVVE